MQIQKYRALPLRTAHSMDGVVLAVVEMSTAGPTYPVFPVELP